MNTPQRKNRLLPRSMFVVFFMLPFVLGSDSCPRQSRHHKFGKMIAEIVEEQVENITITDRLRVHLYPELLPRGTVVRPFTTDSDGGDGASMVCTSRSGCRMFFVDSDHWAHFAHPTAVVLWDPEARTNRRFLVTAGSWWPLVNDEPVFNTVRSREDWWNRSDPDPHQTIIYPEVRYVAYGDIHPDEVRMVHRATEDGSGVGISMWAAPTPCRVWSVLVTGHDDESDTFDDDVEGMDLVLRGHGVPEDQIRRFAAGQPVATNLKEAVKKALTEDVPADIALSGGVCSEFLLFYTSHGEATNDDGELKCDDGWISDCELEGWLDGIPCQRVVVVLEACQSGSFVGEVGSVPVGHPVQTERLLITSTNSSGTSWRDKDVDQNDKDTNPSDTGSETTWGYVEAHAIGASNPAAPHSVTFAEAFNYAVEFDLKSIVDANWPEVRPSPAPSDIVHSCPVPAGSATFKVELNQAVPTDPAGEGELARCRCNRFSATVDIDAGNPPPVASLRLFWSTASNPSWDIANQPHFKEVWDSIRLMPSSGYPHSFDIEWEVSSRIDNGTVLTLLAVVDSPRVPFPGSLNFTELQNHPQASVLQLDVINPSSLFPNVIFNCITGC